MAGVNRTRWHEEMAAHVTPRAAPEHCLTITRYRDLMIEAIYTKSSPACFSGCSCGLRWLQLSDSCWISSSIASRQVLRQVFLRQPSLLVVDADGYHMASVDQ